MVYQQTAVLEATAPANPVGSTEIAIHQKGKHIGWGKDRYKRKKSAQAEERNRQERKFGPFALLCGMAALKIEQHEGEEDGKRSGAKEKSLEEITQARRVRADSHRNKSPFQYMMQVQFSEAGSTLRFRQYSPQ